jgi:predicted O-methyltransferase YrrM
VIEKRIIKSGLDLLFHNPSLLPILLTFDFHKIYCSYFKKKINEAKKMYEKLDEIKKDNHDFLEKIQLVNSNILKKHSRNEAFFIPLYCLVREFKPEIIIETGVHRGVSSLFILQALEDNGKGELYSIDLPLAEYDTDSRGATKSLLPPEKVGVCVSKNLKKRWNLILGDSKIELPKLLSSLKTIDMFLHDSKHTYEHMMWEFDTIWPSLSDDGVLVSDDTNWNTSFVDFSSKVDRKNIQLVRDKISTETFGVILK